MRKLIAIILFTALTSTISGCQSQRKVRRLVSKIDSIEGALKLGKKYPKSDMVIHKLDSLTFFSHSIYSRLEPGTLMQIGQEDGQSADLYKLLRFGQTMNKTDSLHYYVLQFHLK